MVTNEFSWKIHRKLRWWHHKNDHNSKNKNLKNLKFDYSFDSADCGSFVEIWPLLKFFIWFLIFNKLLNQKKNQISDLSNFYFSSYGQFYDVITPIFDEFFTKTHLWPSLSFLFPNRCILKKSQWNRSINEDFTYFQRGLFNNFLGNFSHFYFWILIHRNYRIFIDYLLTRSWSYLVC